MIKRTSATTYHQIKSEGLLSKLRFEVYQTLYKNDPMTAGEVAALFANKRLGHSITPRMAELERRGVIAAVGERRCRITGRLCLVWQTTDNLPVEPPKKPQKTYAWVNPISLNKSKVLPGMVRVEVLP